MQAHLVAVRNQPYLVSHEAYRYYFAEECRDSAPTPEAYRQLLGNLARNFAGCLAGP